MARYGMQVFGPNGEIWLDTNDKTARLLDNPIISIGAGDLNIRTMDFGIDPNERPWCFLSLFSGSLSANISRLAPGLRG